MSTLRQAAEQALEAMGTVGADWICEASHHAKKDQHKWGEPCPLKQRWHVAYQALRAALAEEALQRLTDVQQDIEAALTEPNKCTHGVTDSCKECYMAESEQEPVAWMDREGDLYKMPEIKNWAPPHKMLYTSPPQRKPLTEEEIKVIEEGIWKSEFFDATERQANREFARAIEAAHGIKGEA